jgi:alcohol dehydrogenase class IV
MHSAAMHSTCKEAGVKDNLAKLEQVVKTALEDGAMLNNPQAVTGADAVREIVRDRIPAESETDPGFQV